MNNPITYTDPDGRVDLAQGEFLNELFSRAKNISELDGPYPYCDSASLILIAGGVLVHFVAKGISFIARKITEATNKKNNETILVAHYTSKDNAMKILSTGVIEPGRFETNVFVMKEPSNKKEAMNAGANYTDVKILFRVKPTEVMKDKGTSQPKALEFTISGPVYILNREPMIIEN